MSAYYNEFDPYAAQWLRNLISAGLIASGDVDDRSIADVQPSDLEGYTQCHFFAGIGGWSYAARLAGWPDSRPLWTGSCPCQPYSLAGKGLGQKDERDLWPVWFGLVGAVRPATVMGEQVKDAIGKHWLDRMRSDMEDAGYSIGATVLPACAVDAPHRRDRLWFVADALHQRIDRPRHARASGRHEYPDGCGDVADTNGNQSRSLAGDVAEMLGLPEAERQPEQRSAIPLRGSSAWHDDVGHADDAGWDQLRNGSLGEGTRGEVQARSGAARTGRGSHWANGQITAGRRVEPSIRLLAHGVPGRVGKLRAYGNAIVPQVAAEVIAAFMDVRPDLAA